MSRTSQNWSQGQNRIFDYPKWAEPLREDLRSDMEQIATQNGIEIEFVHGSRKSGRRRSMAWAKMKKSI